MLNTFWNRASGLLSAHVVEFVARMEMMTKEEARLFKERWRLVNEITNDEAQRKSVSNRLRDLEILYQFGQEMGWTNRDDAEEVRWRWKRLREETGV